MSRVAVLFGGISAEREVSLTSGRLCAAALVEAGFEVTPIDVGADPAALIDALRAARPDAVFNALHGRYGEDGCVQGLLDWMGLPYTHSGLRASATAMDKAAAKAVFRSAGLPVAEQVLLTAAELEDSDPLPVPYVIKPVHEGSSVGVHIIRANDNRRAEIARTWTFGQIMAEPFIPGRELTVAVLGDEALTVTDITAHTEFYDYEAKYADGGSTHILPARIHPGIAAEAMRVALAAHQALGCRGVSRADFRYDDTAGEPGRLILLEVNTQPGMTPTSLVPEQAAHRGISFPALCARLVAEARHGT
ncbi:D-alanine-D-alanine ligase [Humitalea rosea]|uniref:D-alanine--D-alanine ligase n=1 Tax=Humitalea rosea TaxID=990373 RepID=A0A2W7HX53_9PROT|nr:D-alanine--D-alanine ligase [Humitalea rosea]PZW37975.1 D-alanine-D-alanine ligase [Humitalea rosea]